VNQTPVSELQRISDELAIGALLARYARAVDTKDWDLLGAPNQMGLASREFTLADAA
jgi:hypothetical protein